MTQLSITILTVTIAPVVDIVNNTDLLFGGILTNPSNIGLIYHLPEYTDGEIVSI